MVLNITNTMADINGSVEAIADAIVDHPDKPAVPAKEIGSLQPIAVAGPFDWPNEELKVLRMWQENDVFQESIRQSQGRPAYSFYDGPPFATVCNRISKICLCSRY